MALMQPHIKTVYGDDVTFEHAYHKIFKLTATVERIVNFVEVYCNIRKCI